MQDTELNEIEKYCSPYSLLVINSKGELIRVDCPFQVVVVLPIDSFKQNAVAVVSEVKMEVNLLLIYVIQNKGYYYWNFAILL